MLNAKKIFLQIIFLLSLFLVTKIFTTSAIAATCSLDAINACGTNSSCLSEVESQCKQDGERTHVQVNTLSNQVAQFDSQIKLTTLKIAQTEAQISLLGGRIDQLGESLDALTTAFSNRAIETHKLSKFENNFIFVLSAVDANEAVSRLHYLQKIQEEDRNLMEKLQTAKTTYVDQKQDQEDLEKQLKTQQTNLNAQKVAKAKLLADTRGSEAQYQSILSRAQAALAALSGYAESVGVSLLPHQELSDSWGKYFNQRDQQWGNLLVNGDSTDCRGGKCTLARIGCLVTSYAMVVSHYGGSLIPSDVATNPSNFSANTADFNNPGPSANGHGVTRRDNPSTQELKDILNSGGVVIAGLSRNGGSYPSHYSDHWVVLRSVDGDSFKINDPVYPGAMNVSLKDHYSGWTIIQARIYN